MPQVSELSLLPVQTALPALTDQLVAVVGVVSGEPHSVLVPLSLLAAGDTELNIGVTPILGSTDQAILFDKAGIVSEDTNLKWDYTNHILNLGPNARLNSIGTTFRFDVSGLDVLDWGVTQNGNWVTPGAFQTRGPNTGFFANGLNFGQAWLGDWFTSNNLSGLNLGLASVMGFSSSSANAFAAPYVYLGREAAGVLELAYINFIAASGGVGSSSGAPAGFRVYNSVDVFPGAPTNYERAIFDWTTTSNVLTIGTQKGGTGSTRNLQFVVGGTNFLDYGITNANAWTFQPSSSTVFNQTANATGPGYYLVATSNSRSIQWYLHGSSDAAKFSGLYDNNNTQSQLSFDGSVNQNPLLCSNQFLSFTSTAQFPNGAIDTSLSRNAAGILQLLNAGSLTSACGFQVYKTTDAATGGPTNYERGVFDWNITSNVLTFGMQKGGTGSSRPILFTSGGNVGSGISIFGQVVAGPANLISWSSNALTTAVTEDTSLGRGAAHTLMLTSWNSALTNPTAFQVYNTTDTPGGGTPTNFERGVLDWITTTNVLTFGTQVGGTGSARNIQFVRGNVNVMDYNITANGTLFVNDAGAAGQGQVSTAYYAAHAASGQFTGYYCYLTADGGNRRLIAALDGANNGFFGLADGTVSFATVALFRDASNIFGINNSTPANPVGLRLYNTSDTTNIGAGPTTNYERAAFDWTSNSNVLTIGTQANGTGTLRNGSLIANVWGVGSAFFANVNGLFNTGSLMQFTTLNSGNYNIGGINLGANVNGAAIQLVKTRGTTPSSQVIVQANDTLGTIDFGGSDGAAFRWGATINAAVDGTPALHQMPTRLVFFTSPGVSNDDAVERARIDHSGNMTVGGFAAITELGVTPIFQVASITGNAAINLARYNSGGTASSILALYTGRGATIGAHGANVSGDPLSSIYFVGDDGTSASASALVTAVVDAAVATGHVPGRLSLQTANTSGTMTEFLRGDSAQLVGATSTTGGLGYYPGLGVGGTVTQLTSKSTAVTLNKLSGQITMNNASLTVNTGVAFTVNNTTVKAGDNIIVNIVSGNTTNYIVTAGPIVASTSFSILVFNVGATASDALVLNYTIIRGTST